MKTWVVVANTTEARIFEGAGPSIREIEVICPVARNSTTRDVDAGAPTPLSNSDRLAAIRRTILDENSASRFALRVAAHLERATQHGGIQQLVLVAEPRFLGLITMWLSKRVAGLVVQSIPESVPTTRDLDLTGTLERTARRSAAA